MSDSRSPGRLIRELLAAVMERDAAAAADLYAPDAVHRNPFRPGRPSVRGRRAIRRHYLEGVCSAPVRFHAVDPLVIHELPENGVAVAEFTMNGVVLGSREPYNPCFVLVLRARDGLIEELRDYEDIGARPTAPGREGRASDTKAGPAGENTTTKGAQPWTSD
ncbi:nuclear transport factor 2 family protein [Streptomyces sp. NPDC035033]|uniref:nuclear transport factor 2 family protein n=1 Tax=Streptomyces sp. NPDC035033 TaxID=3155368 RepID=UPI0034046B48